jgi:myo-inositol-1(or 4)-monophosphatase
MRDLLVECTRAAGAILMKHFGRTSDFRVKENASSIVTEADLESERSVMELIHKAFPGHGILGEESGYRPGGEPFTWVIDPLDGTSNFAAGVPWFGVMIAVLQGDEPILGSLYLPITDTHYLAGKGQGATRNGEPLTIGQETQLKNVLCACGVDASAELETVKAQTRTLAHLVQGVRNIRCTNSLIDFCYTLDGKFGGAINHCTKIWDIAALRLVFEEAGGCFTDLAGQPVRFDLSNRPVEQIYPVMAANPVLHAQLLEVLRAKG